MKTVGNWLQDKFLNLVSGHGRGRREPLVTVPIKNKKLAKELEEACRAQGGALTYAEYLEIDQFGKHGYHATHKIHGMTNTCLHWGKPLALLCKESKINHIIEFGSGDGKLAVEIVKEGKKLGCDIYWSGVEQSSSLANETRSRFKKENLEKHLLQLKSTVSELSLEKKCIVVFSFSLDSVPPEIFINTKIRRSYPDGLVGVFVHDMMLSEVILTPAELAARGISLVDGMLVYRDDRQFNLTNWRLYRGQRAYVGIEAFVVLAQFAQKVPKGSFFVIIDEFKSLPVREDNKPLSVPVILTDFMRYRDDWEYMYKKAGDCLLCYPLYFSATEKLLASLGFPVKKHDAEKDLAMEIVGKTHKKLLKKLPLCFAMLTKPKQSNTGNYPILLSPPELLKT